MPSDPASTRTTMAEDYLKVIWKAEEWADEAADSGISTNEIAATLGVSASTVSGNLRKLDRDGYLDYEPYRRIALSDQGRAIAVSMVRRHRLIETYLVERLGYGWDEVHDEAEVLEHAVSDRLLDRFDLELGHPTADPHGDPIPDADLRIDEGHTRSLGDLAAGTAGRFVRVSDADPEMLRYLGERGIAIGDELEVVDRQPFDGPMTVRFGDNLQILGGALVTETVFTWPGMGRLFLDSLGYNDYPVVMGLLMFSAVLVLIGSLVADLVTALVDPRIRLA